MFARGVGLLIALVVAGAMVIPIEAASGSIAAPDQGCPQAGNLVANGDFEAPSGVTGYQMLPPGAR
jgi:hypothetical protein